MRNVVKLPIIVTFYKKIIMFYHFIVAVKMYKVAQQCLTVFN